MLLQIAKPEIVEFQLEFLNHEIAGKTIGIKGFIGLNPLLTHLRACQEEGILSLCPEIEQD